MYRNTRDFCALILYLVILLHSLVRSSNFLVSFIFRIFYGEKVMAPHSSTLAWKIPMDGGVHGVAKSQTRLSNFTFTFCFHALEKEMATHSSILAWRIPGTGGQGRGEGWWAAAYGVAQRRTWLKQLSNRSSMYSIMSSAHSESFTSFPIWLPLILFLLWLLWLGLPK